MIRSLLGPARRGVALQRGVLARAPAPLAACGARSIQTYNKLPTLEEAKAMPRHVSELSGDLLFVMAATHSGNDAVRERLRREIMAVDDLEYVDTTNRLLEMSAFTESVTTMSKLPYQVGIVTSVTAGWLSLPLVFHYGMASMFNDNFVTCPPPEVGEADTWLEVGSWSWTWMEPPLGALSFFLLCMQFAREQRLQIGAKPFTERIKEYQADTLAAAYPQYDESIVRAYAESIALHSDALEIADEGKAIEAAAEKIKATMGA